MSGTSLEMDRRVGRWWRLFAVALFLLIPVDLLTTFVAISRYGTVVEGNPFMRLLLEHGLVAVTAVNLAVVFLGVSLFHVAMGSIRRAPTSSHRALTHVVNVWMAVLLVGGIVLVANNVLVIV